MFRVVADQLKLRGGLVRCGECRHVFDAIGSLSYVDDVTLTKEKAQAAIGGQAHPGPAVASPPASPPHPPREPPHIAREASQGTREVAHAAREVPGKPTPKRIVLAAEAGRRALASRSEFRDELAVPTLIGIPEPEGASQQRETDSTPADGGYRNRTAPAKTYEPALPTEETEPEAASFLPTPDLRQQRLTRAATIACAPLGLLAAIQFGLTLRTDALETWPSLRPTLVHACAVFGCSVSWPAHGELLTVIGSDEVEAVPGTDVFEMDAAVRSRANFTMALPAIEVTLTDNQNRTIARKVFQPVDYLAASGEPSSRIDEGLAPASDLSVRLVFEARGLSPTRVAMYPFYP
jgi:predicted Zn finger-like uncharacterized protein